MQEDYEEYMNTPLPLMAEEELNDKLLNSKNLFLIGHEFGSSRLSELVDSVRRAEPELIEERRNSISIHKNSFNNKLFVIYSSQPQDPSYFKYPWIDGMERIQKSTFQ